MRLVSIPSRILMSAFAAGALTLSAAAMAQSLQAPAEYQSQGTPAYQAPAMPSYQTQAPTYNSPGGRMPAPGYQPSSPSYTSPPSGMQGQPNNLPLSAPGDPKQWRTPDVTPAQQYATARKEAAAAYSEALKQCRTMSSADRAHCQADAKATLNSDLAAAKRQYGKS